MRHGRIQPRRAASDDAHRALSASTDAEGVVDFAETEPGKQMLAGRRA